MSRRSALSSILRESLACAQIAGHPVPAKRSLERLGGRHIPSGDQPVDPVGGERAQDGDGGTMVRHLDGLASLHPPERRRERVAKLPDPHSCGHNGHILRSPPARLQLIRSSVGRGCRQDRFGHMEVLRLAAIFEVEAYRLA